ncbi:MAG: NADH-quinone oxidoreductase subunit NuoE [Candidatus Aminicenantaceae bacterium]
MEAEKSKIKTLAAKYNYQKKELISILQDIQNEYNYLPQETLKAVSKILDIPLIDIISVATFYKNFSLEPKGEHQITVCMGTACHVRGAPKILEEFERRLGIEAGQTTENGKFSLDEVACLGCCAIGPVVVVDKEYNAQTEIRDVNKILKKFSREVN